MKTRILTAAIAVLIVLASCNLDSGQGVFQQAFNATKNNYARIETVLGTDENSNIIMVADGDLYRFTGSATEKIIDLTKYNSNNSGIVPFAAKDGNVYFIHNTEDGVKMFYTAIDEIYGVADPDSNLLLNIAAQEGNAVNLSGISNPSFISSPTIFNLDEIQFLYKTADNDTTYYGSVDFASISGNTITATGGAEVPEYSRIIGDGTLRAYSNDSDVGYTDSNKLIIIDTNTEIEVTANNNNEYDDVIMGSDGYFAVDYEGDLMKINSSEQKLTTVDSSFAEDLIYRQNNFMPVYDDTASGKYIGYLYECGIYVHETSRTSEENYRPSLLQISDDNDLITSAWIGKSGDKYLMATQENGFWIVEVTGSGETLKGSIHQYRPDTDGELSGYIGN